MAEAPRKAWLVRTAVANASKLCELEDLLNSLEQDSYQVFKAELVIDSLPMDQYQTMRWVIIACDPSLIGKRQGEALAKSMGLLRDAVAASVAAGQAGLPPGVAP